MSKILRKQVNKTPAAVVAEDTQALGDSIMEVNDDFSGIAKLPNGYAEREATREANRVAVDTTIDTAVRAQKALSEFELTIGARNLLNRAIDNVINSKNDNLQDARAKLEAKNRSSFLKDFDGNISIAIDAIVESFEVKTAVGQIYSLLYNVLKAATFIANIDYRRALDPKADFDYALYAPMTTVNEKGQIVSLISKGEDGKDKFDEDYRQFMNDRREDQSVLDGYSGFPTEMEYHFNQLAEIYGPDFSGMDFAVLRSLQDIQLFFQLSLEAFGWSPLRPIPYMYNVIDADKGLFDPVNSAEAALDMQDVKRQLANKKRQEASATLATKCAEIARKKVAEALSKSRQQ